MNRCFRRIILVSALVLLFSALADGSERFRGFERGESGVSLMLGQPFTLRYQYWLTWKQSLFADFGYHISDNVLLAGSSYMFYFYDEKDTWRKKDVTNSIVFYGGPGIMVGFGLGNASKENSMQLMGRGIGGIEYIFGRGQWSLKGEVGGALYFLGRTFVGVQGAVGLSYYWDKKAPKKKKSKRKRRSKKKKSKDPFAEFD